MTRHYGLLPPLDVRSGDLALRCIDDADVEPIRKWRNAQLAASRQPVSISPYQHNRYFPQIF